MGKIYLGNNEIKKIYLGTNEVKKVYLGSTEVWSASSMPSWMHKGIETLLENTSFVSQYYVDIAYMYNGSSGGHDQTYFRVCATSDISAELQKSSNFYRVFQTPYSSSYRGFYLYGFGYDVYHNRWTLFNTEKAKNEGQTEYAITAFAHKAIIRSTFTSFTNATRETTWEDYRT